jgi:hypothetical protein
VRWIIASATTTLVVGGAYILASASRRSRWTAFLDIEGNKEHTAYQVWQSMLSISNGGFVGVGPGAGTSKWGYVPLAHSDFIFTVIAEEFGFIGSSLVIGGFFALTLLGFLVAMKAPDYSGALLAAGITVWFALQATINIGGVVGVMPVTGLTLPLISYGGSSLLISLAAIGLLPSSPAAEPPGMSSPLSLSPSNSSIAAVRRGPSLSWHRAARWMPRCSNPPSIRVCCSRWTACSAASRRAPCGEACLLHPSSWSRRRSPLDNCDFGDPEWWCPSEDLPANRPCAPHARCVYQWWS